MRDRIKPITNGMKKTMILGTAKMMQNKTKKNTAKLQMIFKYFTDCFIKIYPSLSEPIFRRLRMPALVKKEYNTIPG